MHLSSSHRAVPPQPSNTPEWDNLRQTEELSHSELRNTCHSCRRLVFFFFCPDWRHLPFAFERLSKMCELTARCCSLPSEARSSFHSPKGCWANPPLCQIPPAFSVPSTFKEAFDYWMPLAWRMNPTAQSFCVQLISLLWLESEPAGGGLRFLCGVRDRTMLHRFSKWIQLLSKQLRPRKSNNFICILKVKFCDWV